VSKEKEEGRSLERNSQTTTVATVRRRKNLNRGKGAPLLKKEGEERVVKKDTSLPSIAPSTWGRGEKGAPRSRRNAPKR